jgi:hypothetical protein
MFPTGWSSSACRKNYPEALKGIDINRSAYLIRQLRFSLIQYRHGAISAAELGRRLRLFSAHDWAMLTLSVFDAENWRRIARNVGSRTTNRTQALLPTLKPLDGPSSIREFAGCLSGYEESEY